MSNLPSTNRDILINQAYATDEMLLVRQRTHELYSVPKVNFIEWVLDRVTWRGDERVLDLGSGPGTYFDLVRQRIPNGELIAGDLSMGMARIASDHPQAGPIINLDAQSLPFASGLFDIVLANHMLYHVPDLDMALGEIHRVLKPTGVLVAATNSQFNMPEFEQLVNRSFRMLGAGQEVEGMKSTVVNFSLEEGAVKFARHFFAVARYDLPGAFVFPALQPVLDYLNSMRALREPQLPRQVAWSDFMDVMGDQVQRLINHFGELIVNKLTGVIIGTDSGGFANDYTTLLKQEREKPE